MKRVDEVEHRILEVVHDKGRLGFFNGANSPATEVLNAKYRSEAEQQAVMVTVQYLLEERYLFPFFDAKSGEELRNYARGITPKGIDRLRELQDPGRYWRRKNWFPLTVAVITALIGVGSIISNFVIKILFD